MQAWQLPRSRDRNLDIFDKALIGFEQRQQQQQQQQRRLQKRQRKQLRPQKASKRRIISASETRLTGIEESSLPVDSEDEMSRSFEYSQRSVTSSHIGGQPTPRRAHSNVSDVWGHRGGFQRQEVFRRSFRPVQSGIGQRAFHSYVSSAGSGGAGAAALYQRPPSAIALSGSGAGSSRSYFVSETSSTRAGEDLGVGGRHGGRQSVAGSAYFSEGLVINPGGATLNSSVIREQQQQQQQHPLIRHDSTGSVERELFYHRLRDGSEGGAFASSNSQQREVSAGGMPTENVHSEGFLIQRRSLGRWDGRGGSSGGGIYDARQQVSRQDQLYQHQQQLQTGEHPVLKVRQPYHMSFLMRKEAPAVVHSGGGEASIEEHMVSGHSSQRVIGDDQQRQYREVVYSQQHGSAESPRAFVPYNAQTQTQTMLARQEGGGGGFSTIKEVTIRKQQASDKSAANKSGELEAALSRLELSESGNGNKTEETTKTTTTTTKTVQNDESSAIGASSAANHRQNHRQSTVSKVSVQNENHEEESTYFLDGDRLRKRVKHRRYRDGLLMDEKEEVVSLTEAEQQDIKAQRQQWQQNSTSWGSTSAGAGKTSSTTAATATSSTEQAVTRQPKKRCCACCFPRHKRYRSTQNQSATRSSWTTRRGADGTVVTETTTTTTAAGDAHGQRTSTTTRTEKSRGCCGGRKKKKDGPVATRAEQNGKRNGLQVAFEEHR